MSKIIDTADEQAKKAAAAQPHGFVYLDKLFRVKTDGYQIQLTAGWETPNDSLAPVITPSMPAPFAKELAEALLEAYREAAEKRKAD